MFTRKAMPACPEIKPKFGMGAEAGWRKLRIETVKEKKKPSKIVWRLWPEINDKDLLRCLQTGIIIRQKPQTLSKKKEKSS